uniref:Rhoptry-associated protein 1 (RAP-1), putative n=1 Tax=Theileria annulata TaxID=5874 RepID=A0A3B0MFZ4_THEAN
MTIIMANRILIFITILVILNANKSYCNDDSYIEPRETDGSERGKNTHKTKFEKLQSQCFNSEDDLIPCLMNAYLTVYKLKPEGFCNSGDQNCLDMVKSYDQRCSQDAEGCLILDSVDLVELSKGHVYVPDLVQVEVSNFIFRKSGAYKSCEWPNFTCVGECNTHCDCKSMELIYKRDFKAFVKLLTDKNTERMGLSENSDLAALNIFLYTLLLYYTETYLYKDDGANWANNRNLQSTLRYSKSRETKKLFSKMRRNHKTSIFIEYSDLQKLFDALVKFLTTNPIRKHQQVALSFAKIVRHTIVKSVPYYKHSYLFVDVLKHTVDEKFGPSCCSKSFYETFCDPYSPNGRKLFESFVNRCLEGRCYVFDDYNLFTRETTQQETENTSSEEEDGHTSSDNQDESSDQIDEISEEIDKDKSSEQETESSDQVGIKAGDNEAVSNYILPNLSEVNLVYYLLKHTNFKQGRFRSFFTNTTRPRAEIKYMAPRLLYINKIKFQVPNATHEIIQTFLYYCAIFFVKTYREYWTTRGARHLANWDVKSKLTQYLLGLAKGRELIIQQEEIVKIIPRFREYLLNSYYRNHPKRVDNFVGKMEEVLMAYHNDTLGNISCWRKPCAECY